MRVWYLMEFARIKWDYFIYGNYNDQFPPVGHLGGE